MKNKQLSKSFLESKINSYGVYGNIDVISNNVYKFHVYNLLPSVDGKLDGHYTIYVNTTNFEYLLYKSSDYGGLTYTLPSLDINFVQDLNEREKTLIESIIASKILGAYNHGDSTSLYDSSKISLLCDYRGFVWCDLKPNERSDKDIEAISILDPEHKVKIVKKVKLGKILNVVKRHQEYTRNNFKKKPDIIKINIREYTLPIHLTFKDKTKDTIYLKRELIGSVLHYYTIHDTLGNPLTKHTDNYRGKPSNIIKMIPKFIESL